MMDGSRRSTAAQFFLDDAEGEVNTSYNHQVAKWLSEASISVDTSLRLENLSKAQEIMLNKEPNLLYTYLDELLAFQTDRCMEARKLVAGFIEEAIKKDCELLPRVMDNLMLLLQDKSAQVQKRIIQGINKIYRISLGWLAKASYVTDEMQAVWNKLSQMKAFIINMVDCDNDGLRTQIVKFLESIVLLQTYLEPDSVKRDNDFSLEDVPLTLKIARRRKLEEEAMTVFDLMIKFHGSVHISSVNLMACMGSLTAIAKLRPQFMGRVIGALETLHINLPPTLTTSQVNSVRKHLKMQLLNLLRHPASFDFNTNITTLLTDLGATTQEVMRSFPKSEELKKRVKRPIDTSGHNFPKKPRIEESPSSDIVDVESFISQRLTPEVTADIVVNAMVRLPDKMPSVFSSTYTPIAAAGTQGQIKHLARLLAAQMTAAGLFSSSTNQSKLVSSFSTFDDDDEDLFPSQMKKVLDTVEDIVEDEELKGAKLATSKLPKLTEMVKTLAPEVKDNLQVDAIQRILDSEEGAISGGVSDVRLKLIATLAASFSGSIRQAVYSYILGDIRGQLNLALTWLYEEYSLLQGFNKRPPNQLQDGAKFESNYNNLLCILINAVIERKEIKDREMLLSKLYLEVPYITDESVELIKSLCTQEVTGLNIVHELALFRPPKQLFFLNMLLANTSHQNIDIRLAAIDHALKLYLREDVKSIIEEYSVMYLKFLCLPQPPDVLFGADKGRELKQENWNDDGMKACLFLYLAVLPLNQELVHELAKVYIQTSADIKRTILRVIDEPIKSMGMESPQLLKLVEDCPKGSETLVTRIIHILTDKNPPSEELVSRVRQLYQTRVSDVRFLIPVLNGLSKNEVIAALPKLIKLNPIVVKEVFNRLLGTQTLTGAHTSPITPAELLIALHNIEPTKCELKTVIKATSLCFADKQAYTQEVLAVVMQHLMEISPLPTLLMRTVIQALSLYPRLIGFVMNILQRLILKQVWKQKKVWEGFIKCCQRTQPHSFQVLLQLPGPQLADVFEESPDLKTPLLDHIMGFTENQRAHIPQSIMDILLGPSERGHLDFPVKEEPVSPPDLTIDFKEESDDFAAASSEPAPPGLE